MEYTLVDSSSRNNSLYFGLYTNNSAGCKPLAALFMFLFNSTFVANNPPCIINPSHLLPDPKSSDDVLKVPFTTKNPSTVS